MKRIMRVYESTRIAIRISFLGFLLIAFGFLIQNESVNIFYTFKNTFILFLAEGSIKIGSAIILNLPLIFMLNIVCKRANSSYPVCLAIVGYFAYLIVTTLFSSNALASTAYTTNTGINSILNSSTGTKYPLETGLIGSFIVAYITRFSFIRSRHRTSYSILGFLHKDSAGLIYNLVFCALAGLAMSYIWPFVFNYLQVLLTYISKDLLDPLRMALYGILDRILSMLSLNTIIRQPFWYTALGGSLQTISGQSIIGDVNIWNYVKNIDTSYVGAGRFVTAYYVINMFVVPAIYIGIVSSISDKQERRKYILPCIGGIIFSFVCGNPLPLELVLLFSAPLLLLFYLLCVGGIFYYLNLRGVYLGSSLTGNVMTTAMPGNFPDFIINLRNVYYIEQLGKILLVGIVAFAICLLLTWTYYHFLAFDFSKTGKSKKVALDMINAVGTYDNIESVGSGFMKVCFHLHDLEKVNIDLIQQLNIDRISETKDGIDIECGSSAYIISKTIKELIKSNENKQ